MGKAGGIYHAAALNDFFKEVSYLALFTGRFFREVLPPPYELRQFIRQSYLIAFRSFPLVGITGFIMGLVLTIQTQPILTQFGAEAWLPAMVSLSLIREIGPVITALICAGEVSSSMGAELGSMKVTEQIDAMQVSGTNPFKYLVVTRVLAATLMVPLLVIIGDAVGLCGSFVGVNLNGNISLHLFFSKAMGTLNFSDLLPAFVKTFFFGFAIGLVGCFKGYYSSKGTEGVGKAANSAVVIASLLVFIIDMIAVQITSLFFSQA
ncbi:MAG: ABC transporter permease [Candidatus Raymondbacteria bacterium RifOxyA12_full_50_37]|uniref:ABC transporter permease n=1 Tax=Candidatus Raymondbacteria bacterium RIFOXYD12_FULL_49_13 TaxID=1817890 RepID=A0A1F7FAY6_UNCRA|nr:MAG: ABC transporter permease [Candidatus Raymondbacteria bacterium RifOxyA12_full_50_37]OGJ92358.1 MAG: ABC transporter permease [Candidatus Raymondbacteria bacterium RIFOXYA2_FULL_49_16]OGJ96156.1 MAG: ABC transporter permease [Candidatus Raymondbacteria bacterium RifOxyB12_full_50_8]OGJ99339.1 MAG: ABC transporter permease [Candidatus Raymondbacteria bacterium RIFOXYC2_FULL_50_21]OGK03646.1 MAG: ABC transporter permease [Candidatus Raymondbacteria bacterium RIFOXYD12_FULL_49_13]OGK04828.